MDYSQFLLLKEELSLILVIVILFVADLFMSPDAHKNAEGKLERKNFDFIVLNSLNDAGAGFRHDTNKISIIDRKGREDYPLKPKQEVAQDIINHLVAVLTH